MEEGERKYKKRKTKTTKKNEERMEKRRIIMIIIIKHLFHDEQSDFQKPEFGKFLKILLKQMEDDMRANWT